MWQHPVVTCLHTRNSRARRAAAVVAGAMCLSAWPATTASACTVVYHRDDTQQNPGKPPGWDDPYWPLWPEGGLSHLDREYVLIGGYNVYDSTRVKSVTYTIKGTNLHSIDFKNAGAKYTTDGGTTWKNPNAKKPEKYKNGPVVSDDGKTLMYGALYNPQPDGEWLQVYVPLGTGVTITSVGMMASCYKRLNAGWKHEKKDARTFKGPVHIKEIWYFPSEVPLDDLVEPTFSAPPGTGDWSYTIVSEDASGNPMPQLGVKWRTDGVGLTETDEYDVGITMKDDGTGTYTEADLWYQEFIGDDIGFGTGEEILEYSDLWIECPEPATLALLGFSAIAMVVRRRRVT